MRRVTGVSRLLRQGELERSGKPRLRKEGRCRRWHRGQSETGLGFRAQSFVPLAGWFFHLSCSPGQVGASLAACERADPPTPSFLGHVARGV